MQVLNVVEQIPSRFASLADAAKYLQMVCELPASILPERCGYYEPYKLPFDVEAIPNILSNWREVCLTRVRPAVQISTDLSARFLSPIHSSVYVIADAGDQIYREVCKFALDLARGFRPDLAVIHAVGSEEVDAGRESRSVSVFNRKGNQNHIIITTHELRRYLPQLYWGTVFGPPYVKLFGRDRLLSAPAPIVQEFEYGAIYLQLSENTYDLLRDYPRINAIR